jgi:hypothetical protein
MGSEMVRTLPVPHTLGDKSSPTNRLARWRDRTINLFLVFHLFAIPIWCLPSNSLPMLVCRELVRPYFLWSGLFQTWDMFSPSPKRTNGYLEAMVVYTDGTSDYWQFPRMDRLSFSERYSKERYRKFEENLSEDKFPDIWPDVARYIARRPPDRSKRPEMIMLIANWSDLVRNADGSFTDSPWQSRVFYRYRVEPQDLNQQ